MSEATALEDHADEVILPIIALASGYNGAVISITKDLELYVRNDGSDSNDGYADTGAHAFSTGTRAYEEAKRYVPSGGAQVIINLGPGVFSPIQAIGYIPGPPVIFRGEGALFTSVVKYPAAVPGNAAIYADGANIKVENLKLGGNSLGNGLMAINGGIIDVGVGIDFGAIQPSGGAHMYAQNGGIIYHYNPYTISGGATRHLSAWGAGSLIEGGFNDVVVTIPNAIEFTGAFAEAGNEGTIYNSGTNYVGRELVTGQRFYAYQFGYINTDNSGLNYFPGTIDGIWETGGAYDTMGGANQGPPGVAGPMGPKSMSLQLPITGDEVTMFYARAALTITQINAVVRGTTPGVTWQVLYAAARNNAGTPVLAATNTTSLANNTITTFTNPNVPANSWVWMKVTATSGVALELGLSLQF